MLHRVSDCTAGNYSRLACEFYFTRSLGYYVIHIYVPSCLIVVLSWISFWLHRDASPARVSLGITTVLTMTTILSTSNASLPKISYLKSIDIFLVTCFVMVFCSLIEYACVNRLGQQRGNNTASRSTAKSRWKAAAAAAASGGGRELVPLTDRTLWRLAQGRSRSDHGHVVTSSFSEETDVIIDSSSVRDHQRHRVLVE